MVALLLVSGQISGAEKRGLKIAYHLNSTGFSCKLFLTQQLYDKLMDTEYRKLLTNYVIFDKNLSFLNKFSKVPFLKWIRRGLIFFELQRAIKDNRIELIHVFIRETVSKYVKIKSIFEITSPDKVEQLKKRRKNYLKGIDYFNAVSDPVYYKSLSFIPEEKISKAPIAYFNPLEYSVNDETLFQEKENVIIFAHRLIPRKNGKLFANVSKEFLKRNPDWRIKILGKGDERELIDEILTEEIKSGRVESGYTSQILKELEASKIFVSIIQPDNYPSQSVLEAMHTGNALLLSDIGFTKEKFYDNNGYLCKIDESDVLEKLELLVSDIDRLQEFGKNSKRLVQKKYDPNMYINFLKELYRKVLAS